MYPSADAACASVHPAASAAARHRSHASCHNPKAHTPSSSAFPCIHTTPGRVSGGRHTNCPVSTFRRTSKLNRSPDWYWYRFTHPSFTKPHFVTRLSANVGSTAKHRYHRRASRIANGLMSAVTASFPTGSTSGVRSSARPP